MDECEQDGGRRYSGSYPRVRGTQLSFVFCGENATDGSSPRVRGTLRDSRHAMCLAGSSPRVRGTRLGERPLIVVQRFIPACAGNAAPARSGLTPDERRFIPACAGNATADLLR